MFLREGCRQTKHVEKEEDTNQYYLSETSGSTASLIGPTQAKQPCLDDNRDISFTFKVPSYVKSVSEFCLLHICYFFWQPNFTV